VRVGFIARILGVDDRARKITCLGAERGHRAGDERGLCPRAGGRSVLRTDRIAPSSGNGPRARTDERITGPRPGHGARDGSSSNSRASGFPCGNGQTANQTGGSSERHGTRW